MIYSIAGFSILKPPNVNVRCVRTEAGDFSTARTVAKESDGQKRGEGRGGDME